MSPQPRSPRSEVDDAGSKCPSAEGFLDSNILVSLAVTSSGALRELADAWLLERRFIVLSSDHVLQEVERALGRPFFAKRIPAPDRAAYLALVRREALVLTPHTKVRGVASDSQDDAVLAAALDGGAHYLVTGDQALREIGRFSGIDIVGPREFLEIVGPELDQ